MNSKQRKGVRRKGIRWDYNRDGAFCRERWTAEDRQYWTRWLRRQSKSELMEILDELNTDFTEHDWWQHYYEYDDRPPWEFEDHYGNPIPTEWTMDFSDPFAFRLTPEEIKALYAAIDPARVMSGTARHLLLST